MPDRRSGWLKELLIIETLNNIAGCVEIVYDISLFFSGDTKSLAKSNICKSFISNNLRGPFFQDNQQPPTNEVNKMKKHYDQELTALLLIGETGLVRNKDSRVFFDNTKDFYNAFRDLTMVGSEDNKNVHLMIRLNYPYSNFYGEVQDNYNKFVFSIEKKYDEQNVWCFGSIFTGTETKQVFSCKIKSKKKAKVLPFADVVLAYKKARAENNLASENIADDFLGQL